MELMYFTKTCIIKVLDSLTKENGKFYNLQEIRERIGIPVNHLHYQGVIDSIKS